MLTEPDAKEFAREWIAAWNSHDLEAIVSHYAADAVLISPVAAKILADPSGNVAGQSALRNYFNEGLDAFPEPHFEFLDVMFGLSSVVLVYLNQRGTKTAEFMELGDDGKVLRSGELQCVRLRCR